MTEFTFTSKDPKGLLCVLGEASIEFANENAPQSMALIDELRDQLRAQVKPAVEEPTGDCVVFVFGLAYKRQDNGEWWPLGAISDGWEWPNLIQECISQGLAFPVIYRREEPCVAAEDPEVLRIGVGAEYDHPLQQLRDILFRSPSGEMTNREGAEAYKALRREISILLEAEHPEQTPTYQQGFDDCALHFRQQLIQLRSSAITAERQDAYDKAIEAVEALS